jgi:hypothetical protein
LDNTTRFVEVLYFFYHRLSEDRSEAFAMVLPFSSPHPILLSQSLHTLISCEPLGDNEIQVIPAKSIVSVIAMVPHRPIVNGVALDNQFYVVEKPGLDICTLSSDAAQEQNFNET